MVTCMYSVWICNWYKCLLVPDTPYETQTCLGLPLLSRPSATIPPSSLRIHGPGTAQSKVPSAFHVCTPIPPLLPIPAQFSDNMLQPAFLSAATDQPAFCLHAVPQACFSVQSKFQWAGTLFSASRDNCQTLILQKASFSRSCCSGCLLAPRTTCLMDSRRTSSSPETQTSLHLLLLSS